MTDLILERKVEHDSGVVSPSVAMTPAIDERYWSYRVRLTETQAIVGFPKFFTFGIGFAVEDDWNTNLPYTCDATQILDHISDNKGDESISDGDVLAAIEMVQAAVREDLAEGGKA